MHSSIALRGWLEQAKDDEVIVDPTDIHHEAMSNMWAFSPAEDEKSAINSEGVVDFLNQIIEARRGRLFDGEMLFYCWHDFQCRQLRFSLVSRSHGRLPFGCEVSEVKELSAIAEQVVNKDWLNEGYMQAPTEEEHEQQDFILPVFVTNVP